MTFDLHIIDWVAISAIATSIMAVATFVTIRNSKKQFIELQRQNFENALFNLLDKLETVHNQVKYQDIDDVTVGSDGFTSAWNDFKRRMDIELYQDANNSKFQERVRTEEAKRDIRLTHTNYFLLIENNATDFISYFNSLLSIIKYIDTSSFPTESKRRYMTFVSSQLTEIDVLWLFYICVLDERFSDLKRLVEKWSLLKNIKQWKLIHSDHISWISPNAFN
ncbi:putative phage abortive infection protein [Xylanibacter muris]|uniref:putative phage abortive infection protein n=1 Tax=Xylanibacter muris TaxID=2736290 RepID=UPI0025A18283|nr:putative phage abortive infection protein [Xylanibacter muris]